MERGDHEIQISHLFSADDTLIFYQPEEKRLLKLRCVFLCFQAVSGLNVYLKMSELVRIGDKRGAE